MTGNFWERCRIGIKKKDSPWRLSHLEFKTAKSKASTWWNCRVCHGPTFQASGLSSPPQGKHTTWSNTSKPPTLKLQDIPIEWETRKHGTVLLMIVTYTRRSHFRIPETCALGRFQYAIQRQELATLVNVMKCPHWSSYSRRGWVSGTFSTSFSRGVSLPRLPRCKLRLRRACCHRSEMTNHIKGEGCWSQQLQPIRCIQQIQPKVMETEKLEWGEHHPHRVFFKSLGHQKKACRRWKDMKRWYQQKTKETGIWGTGGKWGFGTFQGGVSILDPFAVAWSGTEPTILVRLMLVWYLYGGTPPRPILSEKSLVFCSFLHSARSLFWSVFGLYLEHP